MSAPAVPTVVDYIFPAGVTDPPQVSQIFGSTPFNTAVEVTGPVPGSAMPVTQPLTDGELFEFATKAATEIMAAMVGGTETSISKSFGRWTVSALQEQVQLPNGAMLNAGDLICIFKNAQYPLAVQAGIVQNVCQSAGFNVVLNWTLAPVAPPAPPTGMIGAAMLVGFAFGPACVLGLQGTSGVNVWNGMICPDNTALKALVYEQSSLFTQGIVGQFAGQWLPV